MISRHDMKDNLALQTNVIHIIARGLQAYRPMGMSFGYFANDLTRTTMGKGLRAACSRTESAS